MKLAVGLIWVSNNWRLVCAARSKEYVDWYIKRVWSQHFPPDMVEVDVVETRRGRGTNDR